MRYISALFATMIVALMSFPGDANAASQGKRIVHLTGPIQNPFINELARAFTETAKKHGMSVTVQGTPFDAALQALRSSDSNKSRIFTLDGPGNHRRSSWSNLAQALNDNPNGGTG